MSATTPPVLLAYAFRPFFLLTAAYAVAVMLAWVGFLLAGWPLPLGWSALHWHSHEMLYGLVPAAISGFLLTAITNWTGASPVRGSALLALLLLWSAGRAVMWIAAWLPGWLVASVDMLFIPVIAVYAAVVLLRYRNYRNLILVAALAALGLGNAVMHTGFISGGADWLDLGQRLGMSAIALIMATIAGRITPAFTRNWLRMQGGEPQRVHISPWLDNLALASLAILYLLEPLADSGPWLGLAALVAALVNGWRLWRWNGWLAAREPLLWILHLAYLWLVLALALRGISHFSAAVPTALWLHVFGVGAIGVLLLGVMTRVALGHTGRPLRLPSGGLLIYLAINIAALVRLMVAAQWLEYQLGIVLAAISWMLAFSLFALLYWRILSSPRPDGSPG